jgi:hypothetical protein
MVIECVNDVYRTAPSILLKMEVCGEGRVTAGWLLLVNSHLLAPPQSVQLIVHDSMSAFPDTSTRVR